MKDKRRVHVASVMCLAVALRAKLPPTIVADREVMGSTPVNETFLQFSLPFDGVYFADVFL